MNKLRTHIRICGVAVMASAVTAAIYSSVAPQAPDDGLTLTQSITLQSPAVRLYSSTEGIDLTPREKDCLTKNVYHEAGVEPFAGKIAVAQVTLNRLKTGQWGNDVCKVVYSKAQFSWTLWKKKRNETPKGELWAASVEAVNRIQDGIRVEGLEHAAYYHTEYINPPKWAKDIKPAVQIGQHLFYDKTRI